MAYLPLLIMAEDLANMEVIPDLFLETDNDLEIPNLQIDMQATYCDRPFVCFGEQKRTYKMMGSGVLHFYTDDYRFNSIFEHPEKILQHNPAAIVEPNFSIFLDTPIAFGLQAIYKKRWLARTMQECGIKVFVDLNVVSKYYKLNMLGVPKGWSAFCTRGYSERLNYLEFEFQQAKKWSCGNKLLFVIYGGGEQCKQFALKNSCIYISPVLIDKTVDKRALKKIMNTIELDKTINIDRIWQKQVEIQ